MTTLTQQNSKTSSNSNMQLGNSQEIMDIQQQIEIYTKKIEHEKINLKLCNERNTHQSEVLRKLQNKKRAQKKKKSKSKKRESVTKQHVIVKESYLDNPELIYKEVSKKAYDSERLTIDVNKLLLENKNLKAQVESLRKEKTGAQNILEAAKKKCEETESKLEHIKALNFMFLEEKSGKLSTFLFKE